MLLIFATRPFLLHSTTAGLSLSAIPDSKDPPGRKTAGQPASEMQLSWHPYRVSFLSSEARRRDAKLLEIGGGTLEAHHKNLTKDLCRDPGALLG